MPWGAIRALLSQSLYGGRIDNAFDNKILTSLVDQLFTPDCYGRDFPLFHDNDNNAGLTIPDETSADKFLEWIQKLPNVESPTWSGLPVNTERILRTQQTNHVLQKLLSIQDDSEDLASGSGAKSSGKQSWLTKLNSTVITLLDLLPSQLQLLTRTAALITNPLFRFLEREVTIASQLLEVVRTDLVNLREMTAGNIKSNNRLRELATEIYNDQVPKPWKRYVTVNLSCIEWIQDFKARLAQLADASTSTDYGKRGMWLGGLIYPEAYMTATRQAVAQDQKLSLEELELRLDIGNSEPRGEDSFGLKGISLEGAKYDIAGQKLEPTQDLNTSLPHSVMKWVKRDKNADETRLIEVPVYLNDNRNNLLFSVKLDRGNSSINSWYQRGTAFIAWNKA